MPLEENDPLVRKIRSDDMNDRDEGWAIISDELVGYAKGRTSGQNRVNAQATSIVQSVLKDLLDDSEAFENDGHLIGHLKNRVANKLRQRVDPRAGANKVRDLPEAGEADSGSAGSDPSLGSVIASAEMVQVRREVLDDALAALRDKLSAEDWMLVRARAIDGKPWGQLAQALGKSEQALRVRWHRLRPKIEEVLAELPEG